MGDRNKRQGAELELDRWGKQLTASLPASSQRCWARRRAKRLLTRRWKATTAPTTTQWKAEVMEWGKAEGAALRREDNSGMREYPVAPDWDTLMENFETLSEEDE
ncbi:hypothetical protein NDU88_005151 [Pleurodeles waltl]|uniref:Uncharacterized protein n=1 Tax=Pleurodeles waltl TaxID=8319 RepID=A0AAV7NPG5_PLEWA|nr:hypothetical protein NDU88_005151 [Pleurodeles waltl]